MTSTFIHYTNKMLTGQAEEHLQPVNQSRSAKLQTDAAEAFLCMQKAARQAGINLQAASAFRSFARQQQLWNNKFSGLSPLLDANSQLIENSQQLPIEQRCQAILRWSAMPGASRHHWGTDLDIYDPDKLPQDQSLQLVPQEYQDNGYFAQLSQWLSNNMQQFGFYRPFQQDRGGVAPELWHISYYPLSHRLLKRFTPEVLLGAWHHQEIGGKTWLMEHIDTIFTRYIKNIDLSPE